MVRTARYREQYGQARRDLTKTEARAPHVPVQRREDRENCAGYLECLERAARQPAAVCVGCHMCRRFRAAAQLEVEDFCGGASALARAKEVAG